MNLIYNNNSSGYYIYAYLRAKDSSNGKAGTPYYIGKGTKLRYKEGKKKRIAKTPSEGWRIVILESGLTHLGAIALERFYIKWWGRIDNGTGILQNKTDGGDGGHGRIYKPTAEAIEKNRLAHTGKKLSSESIRKREQTRRLRGHTQQTPESVSKMLESKKGSVGWTNGVENRRCKTQPGPEWYIGYTPSDEERERRAKSARSRKMQPKQKVYECTGCGKSMTKGNLNRWHKNCGQSDIHLTCAPV